MKMKCKKCGLENESNAKVCSGCGNKLGKGNAAVVVTIILVVVVSLYLMVINVISIIQYGEVAGFLPKLNNDIDYGYYVTLEHKLEDASYDYLEKEKYIDNTIADSNLELMKDAIITVEDLIDKGIITKNDFKKCKNGYVVINKNELSPDAFLRCKAYKTDNYNSKYEKNTVIDYKKYNEFTLTKKELTKDNSNNEKSLVDYFKKLNENFVIKMDKVYSENYFNYELYINGVKVDDKVIISDASDVEDNKITFYVIGDTLVYNKIAAYKEGVGINFVNKKGKITYKFESDLISSPFSYSVSVKDNNLVINATNIFKINEGNLYTSLVDNCPKGDNCMLYTTKDTSNSITLDEIIKRAKTPSVSAPDRSNVSKDLPLTKEYTFVIEKDKLSVNPKIETIKTLEQFYNEMIAEGYYFTLY